MRFRNWLEELEQDEVIPPSEASKRFWVSDPNNPEQVKAWQKSNTRRVYKFPLAQDKFIHFTLIETVPEILESKVIKSAGTSFAVSLSYGIWFPVVQFNHIINKKGSRQGILAPMDLKRLSKNRAEKLLQNGWRLPNFGEEIGAVMFRTEKMPVRGNAEEVLWSGDIPLADVQQIDTRQAIRLLKKTPYDIGSDDEVRYI